MILGQGKNFQSPKYIENNSDPNLLDFASFESASFFRVVNEIDLQCLLLAYDLFYLAIVLMVF